MAARSRPAACRPSRAPRSRLPKRLAPSAGPSSVRSGEPSGRGRASCRAAPAARHRRAQRAASGWISDLLRRVNDDEVGPRCPSSERGKAGNPLGRTGIDDLGTSPAPSIRTPMPNCGIAIAVAKGCVQPSHLHAAGSADLRRGAPPLWPRGRLPRRPSIAISITSAPSTRSDPERTRTAASPESYLNSDTGKVYTLLAHASGKLA